MATYYLRFQVQSWNRFASCEASGQITVDVQLNFLPDTWSVRSSGTPSGCENVAPSNAAGRWDVDYSNDTQSASALITQSIASPPNPSVVYDSGELWVDNDDDGTPDEPFNPPSAKYNCLNGQCVVDPNGLYQSLAECQAVCGVNPDGLVCLTPQEYATIKNLLNKIKNQACD